MFAVVRTARPAQHEMMSVSLEIAEERHLDTVLAHVRSYHEYEDVHLSDQQRLSAIRALLGESALGRIFLIRHGSEVIGYVAVCFGFSIEFEGRDAFVDEMFIVPAYRGKGHGRKVLDLLGSTMKAMDIRALHLEVARDNEKAQRLYRSAGFESREKYFLMSAVLTSSEAGQDTQEGSPPSPETPWCIAGRRTKENPHD